MLRLRIPRNSPLLFNCCVSPPKSEFARLHVARSLISGPSNFRHAFDHLIKSQQRRHYASGAMPKYTYNNRKANALLPDKWGTILFFGGFSIPMFYLIFGRTDATVWWKLEDDNDDK
ncbi:hypothetical protein niasHT_008709 [Heterodera trifolii]|uniref:Uncharacterized protein n=1 Tax=Heterodera trifolii TaxID=157864 RepID=A0ABD2LTB1_9BILA